jgi:hypothetical protein
MSSEGKSSGRRSSSAYDTVSDLPGGDPYLDELATALSEGAISRRQALKWAGYGMLGAALSGMGFAETAEALGRRARRRCRNKDGVPLERGECHCATKCSSSAYYRQFKCQDNPNCSCRKTAEGRGFCAQVFFGSCEDLQACSSSSECPSGSKCITATCCPNPICLPPCTSTTSSGGQGAASRASGLTDVSPRGG